VSYDTADQIFGPDPNAIAATAMSGPGSVRTHVPAAIDPNLRGLSCLKPHLSPTPWIIGLAVVLVLLMHPKAGFNAGLKVG
jgi:hypothetical protein